MVRGNSNLTFQLLHRGNVDVQKLKSCIFVSLGVLCTDENVGYRFSKNRTEPTSQFKNRSLGFHGSVFKKPTSAVWQRCFTLSHSQFIFQHDRINSRSIFLHTVSLHF